MVDSNKVNAKLLNSELNKLKSTVKKNQGTHKCCTMRGR